MINSDKDDFEQVMRDTSDALGKPFPKKAKVDVFWSDLKQYTLPEIKHAFEVERARHPVYPTVPDLVRVIRPSPMTAAEKEANRTHPSHRDFADTAQRWTDQDKVDAEANFHRWMMSPERRALMGPPDDEYLARRDKRLAG